MLRACFVARRNGTFGVVRRVPFFAAPSFCDFRSMWWGLCRQIMTPFGKKTKQKQQHEEEERKKHKRLPYILVLQGRVRSGPMAHSNVTVVREREECFSTFSAISAENEGSFLRRGGGVVACFWKQVCLWFGPPYDPTRTLGPPPLSLHLWACCLKRPQGVGVRPSLVQFWRDNQPPGFPLLSRFRFRCPLFPPVLHAHHPTDPPPHLPSRAQRPLPRGWRRRGLRGGRGLASTLSSAFAERRRGFPFFPPFQFSLALRRPLHTTSTPPAPHDTHALLLTTHTPHRRDSLLASGSPRLPAQVPLHHQLFNPPSKTFSTKTMRECISIHVGQGGIQTGNACWELYWYVPLRGGGAVR